DLFADIVEMKCAETENGFFPFDEAAGSGTDSAGNVIYTGENYKIIFNANGAEVHAKTSKSSDTYEVWIIPFLK
ncbi:MAG: hypothetical protein IJY74_02125, partial [Oscillospiraceae bacterium]|nr:hypothetical protein [Oscillospiraceae bacterium]